MGSMDILFQQNQESRLMEVLYSCGSIMICRINFDISSCHIRFSHPWDIPLLTRIARLVLLSYLSGKCHAPFRLNDMIIYWKASEWFFSRFVSTESNSYLCKDQLFIRIISIDKLSSDEVTDINNGSSLLKDNNCGDSQCSLERSFLGQIDKIKVLDLNEIMLHSENVSNMLSNNETISYANINALYNSDNGDNVSFDQITEENTVELEDESSQDKENKDNQQSNEYEKHVDNDENDEQEKDGENNGDGGVQFNINSNTFDCKKYVKKVPTCPCRERYSITNFNSDINDSQKSAYLQPIFHYSTKMKSCSSLVHLRSAFDLITYSVNSKSIQVSHIFRVTDLTFPRIHNLFHSCVPVLVNNDGPIVDILITNHDYNLYSISDFIVLSDINCHAMTVNNCHDEDDEADKETCENLLMDSFFDWQIVHTGKFESVPNHFPACLQMYQQLRNFRQLQYTRQTAISYSCIHYSQSWQYFTLVGNINSFDIVNTKSDVSFNLNRIPIAHINVVEVRSSIIRPVAISEHIAILLTRKEHFDLNQLEEYLNKQVESSRIFHFIVDSASYEAIEIREHRVTWMSTL